MLVLLFVALWFILRGDLLYVFPCVILFLCFSVLLVLRLPRFLFFILFTQYFKRVTHLAKISHSTKWPSTNILNSLKTHVIEKSKNIIYTYIHNRHTYLGKRELISVLFARLFGLCLFRFVGFLFLLGSGKGCGL